MKKYYQMNIKDWSPEIMTHVTESIQHGKKYYYASLDVGPVRFPSDMDCSRCSTSRDTAIKLCHAAIIEHADRIGNYDLHFRLGKWWRIKELGLQNDPRIIEIKKMWNGQYEAWMEYEIEEES